MLGKPGCWVAAVLALSLTGCWNEFRGAATRLPVPARRLFARTRAGATIIRAWTATTGGAVNSSPALSAGRHRLRGFGGRQALRVQRGDGASVWTADDRRRGPLVTAWAASNIVYVGSDDHKLRAFDANTGALSWMATTVAAFARHRSSRTVRLCRIERRQGLRVHAATGAPVWSATTGGPVTSSPAVGGSTLYVGSGDGKLYAARQHQRGTRLVGHHRGAVRSTPPSSGSVLVGSDDAKIHAYTRRLAQRMDRDDGWDRGRVTCGRRRRHRVRGRGRRCAAGPQPGDGRHEVDDEPGRRGLTSPTVANGVLYLGTRAGTVKAYNTVDGARVFSDQTGGPVLSSPAELNRRVYVGSGDGKLYAYAPAPLCGGARRDRVRELQAGYRAEHVGRLGGR